MMVHTCNPSYLEDGFRRIKVQAARATHEKQTKSKKAGGVAQVEERFPSKHKTLSSNPTNITKKGNLSHL
jgi:hypothetical protein